MVLSYQLSSVQTSNHAIVATVSNIEIEPAETACGAGWTESTGQTQCHESTRIRVRFVWLASRMGRMIFLRSELKVCFEQLNNAEECRAIVLTGSDRAFSTGKSPLSTRTHFCSRYEQESISSTWQRSALNRSKSMISLEKHGKFGTWYNDCKSRWEPSIESVDPSPSLNLSSKSSRFLVWETNHRCSAWLLSRRWYRSIRLLWHSLQFAWNDLFDQGTHLFLNGLSSSFVSRK